MPKASLLPPRRWIAGSHLPLLALLGVALLVAAAPAAPSGPEPMVQGPSPILEIAPAGSYPAIARTAAGAKLVAWATPDGGVAARRLRGDGSLAPVNELSDGDFPASQLQAAGDASGNFVVVWQETLPEGGTRVVGRRVRPDGHPRGTVFRPFRPSPVHLQANPRVGMSPDGHFAVLAVDLETQPDGSVLYSLRLARFAPGGASLGRNKSAAPGPGTGLFSGGLAATDAVVGLGWTSHQSCAGSGEVRSHVAWLTWSGTPVGRSTNFGDGLNCAGGPRLVALLPSDVGALAVLQGHNSNLQRFQPEGGSPQGPRTVFDPSPPCWAPYSCRELVAAAGDPRGSFATLRELTYEGEVSLTASFYGREGLARSEEIDLSDGFLAQPTHASAVMSPNGTLDVVFEYAPDGGQARQTPIVLRTVSLR
jgi:hypothetical protein